MGPQWTARQAIFLLVASTSITCTLSISGYFVFQRWQKNRLNTDTYCITAIVQTGPEKEALKTTYLAELLHLSADSPTSLYAIHPQEAQQRLLASPLIRAAAVKRMPPNTLYVDYEVRKPIAWIADYKNIAIDNEGYLFPVTPFFSPKAMTEVYLGLPPFAAPEDTQGRKGGLWKSPLHNRHLKLALDLLQTFEGSSWKDGLSVKRIDVSNAFAPTLGRREIVLFTEEELTIEQNGRAVSFTFPKILRLATKDYAEQLQHFFSLRKAMAQDYEKQLAQLQEGGRFAPRIVDLRVKHLAFVENSSH